MLEGLKPWFHFVGTYGSEEERERFEESDDIWSDFEIFQDWTTITNRVEWYQSPHAPTIYEDHKYVFRNIDMGRPYEKYYVQDKTDDSFESIMYEDHELPSGRGDLRIETHLTTKAPPSGDNDFTFIEYDVDLKLKYTIPGGVTLPRILAYPLNSAFKELFLMFIGEDMVERDAEFAREKFLQYWQYIRKYHGEEPAQSQTRRTEYEPAFDQGVFFQ